MRHQLGAVTGAGGGGVTDDWMRSSERFRPMQYHRETQL